MQPITKEEYNSSYAPQISEKATKSKWIYSHHSSISINFIGECEIIPLLMFLTKAPTVFPILRRLTEAGGKSPKQINCLNLEINDRNPEKFYDLKLMVKRTYKIYSNCWFCGFYLCTIYYISLNNFTNLLLFIGLCRFNNLPVKVNFKKIFDWLIYLKPFWSSISVGSYLLFICLAQFCYSIDAKCISSSNKVKNISA